MKWVAVFLCSLVMVGCAHKFHGRDISSIQEDKATASRMVPEPGGMQR